MKGDSREKKKIVRGERIKNTTKKSIQGVDSVLRLWISQQLPLILPVNTKNLNFRCFRRFYSRLRGENDKKSLVCDWGSTHVFSTKNWLLRSPFPLPRCLPRFLIPLVLCAELSDKKTNREFRSRGCRRNVGGGTVTKRREISAASMEISVSHRSRLRKCLLHRLR